MTPAGKARATRAANAEAARAAQALLDAHAKKLTDARAKRVETARTAERCSACHGGRGVPKQAPSDWEAAMGHLVCVPCSEQMRALEARYLAERREMIDELRAKARSAEVAAARKRVQASHPDTGGNAEAFIAAKRELDRARGRDAERKGQA